MHNSRSIHSTFGLLRYDESCNLGDEIQSIAAQQFLPQVNFLVNRNTNEHQPVSSEFFPIKTSKRLRLRKRQKAQKASKEGQRILIFVI